MKKNPRSLCAGIAAAGAAVLLSVIPCLAAGPLQTQGALDDVLIKEKDSMKIESEKAPFVIDIDVLKEILPIDTTLLERHDDLPRISTVTVVRPLKSPGTVSPWLYAIARDPVVTFRITADGSKIARWELYIVDMQGRPFRRLSGKGSSAGNIQWDGRDDKKRFMRVGEIYSYYIVTIDKAGIKKTSITRPFTIDAAMHREKKDIVVSIVPSLLFSKFPVELTVEGKRILTEAADIVKGYNHAPVSVKVCDETDARAQAEAAVAVQFLSDRILVAREKIPGAGYRTTPENYCVDIIIKKP